METRPRARRLEDRPLAFPARPLLSAALWCGIAAGLLASGCSADRPAPRDVLEVAKAPPADSPLRRLERLVGTWRGSGRVVSPAPADPAGAAFTGGGTTTWVLGGRYLRRAGWNEFPGGRTLHFVELITWDAKADRFRSWYFAEQGEFGQTWWELSEDGKTMEIKATGQRDGAAIRAGGTIRFVDDDTLSWSWSEWSPDGPTTIEGRTRRSGGD